MTFIFSLLRRRKPILKQLSYTKKKKKFSDRLTELLTCFLKDKKKKEEEVKNSESFPHYLQNNLNSTILSPLLKCNHVLGDT